jgi:hypothetical protein
MTKQEMTKFIKDYITSRVDSPELFEDIYKTDNFPTPPTKEQWELRVTEMFQNGEITKHGNDTFSIPPEPVYNQKIHNSGNFIMGDNHGNQSLSSSTTYKAAKMETPIIKKIAIGVIIAVVGTVVAWLITSQL